MTEEIFKKIGFTLLVFLGAGLAVSVALALVPDFALEMGFWPRAGENIRTFATFDYGYTRSENIPVAAAIWQGCGRSMILIFGSMIFALVFGLGVGVLAVLRRESLLVKICTSAIYALSSVPTLVWASLLLFAAAKQILPLPTYDTLVEDINWGKKFLVLLLPVAALALGDGMLADIVRLMEQETSRILEQDFIRAVRARNVDLGRHLFRGLVGPAVSIIAGKISYLISGSIVVESIFNWNGLAFKTLLAVRQTGAKDYPLILAMTMLFVGIVLILNLISDLTALCTDPRLRKN